jgi:hypothetical protein
MNARRGGSRVDESILSGTTREFIAILRTVFSNVSVIGTWRMQFSWGYIGGSTFFALGHVRGILPLAVRPSPCLLELEVVGSSRENYRMQ